MEIFHNLLISSQKNIRFKADLTNTLRNQTDKEIFPKPINSPEKVFLFSTLWILDLKNMVVK